MSHLMYSNEDTLITAAELAAVPTPPAMGARHRPVPFGGFLDLVKHRLDRAGITIRDEEYVLDPSGETFFGTMAIGIDGVERDDMELTLGLRGSHNQKVPRGICLGNRVIVCSNLCFGGDMVSMQTKQTTNVMSRLPGLVDRAVGMIPDLGQREFDRADAYRLYQMRPRWGDAALVEMNRRGALTPAQLGRAISEWDRPTYEEHAEDGHTAWRLINAVTEAQKPTGERVNMDTVRARTAIASSFIDEVVGFE